MDVTKLKTGGPVADKNWEMMFKHLEGVKRAVDDGNEMSAFRIAADAVTCLLDAIRAAIDKR